MIIQALVNYYDAKAARHEIARPGWCAERVSFALELSGEGELLAVLPQFTEELRGKKTVEVPLTLTVPARAEGRTSTAVVPRFLCDNAAYLLGLDKDGPTQAAAKKFEASKQYHRALLSQLNSPIANSICNFFDRWAPQSAGTHPAIAPYVDAVLKSTLVFTVNGVHAHDDYDIQSLWDTASQGASDDPMLCMSTGRHLPIARIHPKIIMPRWQAMGVSLVSFNKGRPAFESYGKTDAQGFNAPMGKATAFAYTTALSHMLADRHQHKMLGEDALVYWSEDALPEYQSLVGQLAFPDGNEAHTLDDAMARLARGDSLSDTLDMDKPFYLLCLSPNAARISVRFFHRDRFGTLLENLLLHHKRLDIVKQPWDYKYLSLYWLLQETVNPKSSASEKKPAPLLGGAVLRSILTNTPYPQALYQAILIRIRADQTVNWQRAAIIKAYLTRNTAVIKEDFTMYNPAIQDTAYVLGALFAVLEHLQEEANGTATVRAQFFTSAGTTPGTVFPTLIRLAGHHLAKLENPGARVNFSKEIGQLMDKLQPVGGRAYPAHLNQNDQGLFHLGYYHKKQARYAGKQKEEK